MNVRPDSKQGRNVPTAMRQGTAMRQPTAMRADINMNIVNRPVTNHGLGGIKGLNVGPGRQVVDRSYVLNLLRQKTQEIYQEIEKFRKQIETIGKDNNTYFQLEKRQDEILKEVRNLEGTLADYNLTFDKLRSKTRPDDIKNMYEYIKMQNDRLRAQLDDIFVERKQQEEEIKNIEPQINEIDQQLQMRLNDLDPDQKQDYERLLNEKRLLAQDIDQQRGQLEDINMKLMQAESNLRMDGNKLKSQQLNEAYKIFLSKKDDLEAQLNEANLSFPEARDKLQAKIKEDNSEIKTLDKRLKECQKIIDNNEKKLREMDGEKQRQGDAQNDAQKYEILYQRDKEMSDFINNFEGNRQAEQTDMMNQEQMIVETLETISKKMGMLGALPTKEEFIDIQKEYNFKQGQTENAETTLQMLKIEFQKRDADLVKLEQAEERMANEMKSLMTKIQKMQEEIKNKFSNTEKHQKECMDKKNKLLKDQQELSQKKTNFQQQVKNAEYDYELKETKFNRHDNYRKYNDFEKKFALNEQYIYQLKSYIVSKTKDMNYNEQKQECLNVLQSLNQQLLQQ